MGHPRSALEFERVSGRLTGPVLAELHLAQAKAFDQAAIMLRSRANACDHNYTTAAALRSVAEELDAHAARSREKAREADQAPVPARSDGREWCERCSGRVRPLADGKCPRCRKQLRDDEVAHAG